MLSHVSASITAGPDVKLVNLSRGGALMEVAARYPMRSKVRLKLTRTGEVTQIPGTVSWAKVASIANGKINYLLAVIFDAPIEDLAVVTGVEGIERQALASTAPNPDYEDEAIHAIRDAVPTGGPASPIAGDGPAFEEEDLSGSLLAAPANVAPAATTGPDAAAVLDGRRDLVARAALAAAESRADDLRLELDRATSDVASLSAANDNLSKQLRAFDEERHLLRRDLETARQQWDAEKSLLTIDSAATLARMTEIEAALQQHHQAGSQALADQQALVQTLSQRLETLEAERATLRGEQAAERERWQEERAALAHEAAEAVALASELQAALQAREPEQQAALAEARAMQRVLESRIEALDAERTQWTTTLDTERAHWIEERSALERAAADAAARFTDLQASIERRTQEQAQALDETRTAWQAERQAWEVDRIALNQQAADAAARVSTLEETLQARDDEHVASVAGLQASILSLRTQLESLDAERLETRQAFDAARSSWDDERTRAATELAARAEEFQSALEAREQVHAAALTEQQERFEGLIAELVQAANDQQAEYQQLMAERKAELEEQVLRAERSQSELARVRGEAEHERAMLLRRCHELEHQLEVAEAVTVAQETRYRAVRHEAERLVALLASSPPTGLQAPVIAELPTPDRVAAGDGESAQAVAGG